MGREASDVPAFKFGTKGYIEMLPIVGSVDSLQTY